MDSPTSFLEWGFIQISIPNLLLILGMVLVFVVALIAPFPHAPDEAAVEEI